MESRRRLAALDARNGVFTPAMAFAAGIDRTSLSRLRQKGRITRVCGAGHIWGGGPPTLEQRATAACLTWRDGVVGYRTAAALLELPVADDGATHVLVPNGRKPFHGLVAHHWSIRPADVVVCDGWVMTDRRTTLADCLGRFDDVEAWGLLAWLATRDLIVADDLDRQIADRFHLYGVVRLRAMAAALRRGAVSPAEVELHEFLDRNGFTGWEGNSKIRHRGRVVARAEVLFWAERVVLEFDGRLAHPAARRPRDTERDRLLSDLGYRVIRVRWERLVFQPDRLRQQLVSALARRVA